MVRDLPIFLLVVVLVLLDAVAFVSVMYEIPRHVSKANGAPIYALALSQACLLGLWAGIGRTRTTIRLPAVLAILGALSQSLCYLVPQHPILWYYRTSVVLDLGLTAGLIAVAVGATRLSGLIHLVRVGGWANQPTDAASPKPFQFTISQMLKATASCGLALAILKFVYPRIGPMPGDAQSVHYASIAMFVLPMLVATWAVLNTEFRMWRLGVVVAVTWAIVCASDEQAWRYSEESLGIWPFLALATCALFVCRAGGYRISVRHRSRVALASAVGQCERESTLE